jgi:hypothetical protein
MALGVAAVIVVAVGLGHRGRAGQERKRKRSGEQTFHVYVFLVHDHKLPLAA